MPHRVTTLADLEALYGAPVPNSLNKVTNHLTPEYRALVEAAPFCVLATVGPNGVDVSPRGDGPGFVHVADDRTLMLPDRRGNNRLDSLKNIVADPRVSALFLIPGVNETLRVAGTAEIRTDPDLLTRFATQGKAPASVLRIAIERAYFQCAKALVRSALWDPASRVDRRTLPSTGALLAGAQALAADEVAAYDEAMPARHRATLY